MKCGKEFVPKRENYQYCQACYAEVAPLGRTSTSSRPGAPAHIYGGVSRVTDKLRPVTLRGDITSRQIIEGMASFLTDLYERPAKLSTLLSNTEMSPSDVECLRAQNQLNDFVLRFCPKLWEWLGTTIGYEARKVVVDSYALYGGRRRHSSTIARGLGITADQVEELRRAALSRLRVPEKRAQLEAMVVSTARSVLEAYLKSRQASSFGVEHRPPI